MDLEDLSFSERLRIDAISSSSAVSQFSSLLDAGFSVPPGQHYFDDFPIWNPPLNEIETLRIGIFDQDQLVSFAGVRLGKIRLITGQLLDVAFVGAVGTHPNFREKGLASQVVQHAVDWAQKKGASLAVLWGSEYQLYHRLGFDFFGYQCRVPLDQLDFAQAASIEVKEGWTPALFELIRKRGCGLHLGDSDRSWYEAHKNVKWYYTGKMDCPTSYAARGRGIDLPHCVHEWGGEKGALLAILKKIQSSQPGTFLLGHPALLEQFSIQCNPSQFLEHLCLAKVLCSNALSHGSVAEGFWVWGLDAA